MRTTIALLIAAACGACSPAPDAPEPPSPPTQFSSARGAVITGSIVDETGVCIQGAVAEIVAGPGVGARIVQATPCDSWSDAAGFTFRDLQPGDKPTIRASAAGYRPEERAVTATGTTVAYESFVLVRVEVLAVSGATASRRAAAAA